MNRIFFDSSNYRGGWQPSYPPLIRLPFYSKQKTPHCGATQDSLVTLSCIAKFSRLLRPVGPGFMFSVHRTEKFRIFGPYILSLLHNSANLRSHLRAIALTTRTDYSLVEQLPQQQANPTQSHPKAHCCFKRRCLPAIIVYRILRPLLRDYLRP